MLLILNLPSISPKLILYATTQVRRKAPRTAVIEHGKLVPDNICICIIIYFKQDYFSNFENVTDTPIKIDVELFVIK